MGEVSGVIDVHFIDLHETRDKIHVVMEYIVPMEGGKWVVRGVVEKTYRVEVSPEGVNTLPQQDLERVIFYSSHYVGRVLDRMKPVIENKTREFLGFLSPRRVIFDDLKTGDYPYLPDPTYDGDGIAVCNFDLSLKEEKSMNPPKVTYKVKFVHIVKYSFEATTLSEVERILRGFHDNYMKEIVHSSLHLLYDALDNERKQIKEVLDYFLSEKGRWEVKLTSPPVGNPLVSVTCYHVEPSDETKVKTVKLKRFNFTLPRFLVPPLREKWEKSKGNLREMIDALRFIMAFGSDFDPPDGAREFLDLLDELERTLLRKGEITERW
ncbi:MAG: hypothetical protein QXV20_06845 [Candidatus Hadarchaeales archaeon]